MSSRSIKIEDQQSEGTGSENEKEKNYKNLVYYYGGPRPMWPENQEDYKSGKEF